MISLDVKADSKASSPLGLGLAKEAAEESTLSFSALLSGAKDSKFSKDTKGIQNGSFVVALDLKEEVADTKLATNKDSLLSLLKGDSKIVSADTIKTIKKEDIDALELNPKVIQNLSVAEVKTLIYDAKQFLKQKIMQSDDSKILQAKDLPKTLKGLSDMAKSLGIDMSKITLEEVKVSAKEVFKADAQEIVEIQVKVPKNKIAKVQTEQEAVQEIKVKDTIKEDVKLNDKRVDILKEVKATPLFKAQEKTELTTEQIVQTKQFKVEEKTPKTKADETLKLLLRGDKPSLSVGNTTADFSVATARVIAPTATSEAQKSFEQLLRASPEESTSKTDGLSTHKADSFEVKLNEAKQMIKYLSADVKTAIEDYKSPFTRIKVQLNPQQLGEVDVTIVQRGKNLHVNISSNTAAINTLAMNANELKTQLNNNGINNASLNFNNSEQHSQEQNSQQQRNRQNERDADEEYNYFETQEQNEEILSSLEIVVPNYA
ncbi:MAG: flagellar hook-length control protein FliK [Sulfurimonas sp.]|nr:flagellar hook-length control protein FliK [Sulfurimonas sp.]MDQ7060611.1 flagellar hook-length control protein FliK [Sulfurimonas sp.]